MNYQEIEIIYKNHKNHNQARCQGCKTCPTFEQQAIQFVKRANKNIVAQQQVRKSLYQRSTPMHGFGFLFLLLGPHLWPTKVSRLQGLNCSCNCWSTPLHHSPSNTGSKLRRDLHHSPWHILNPLREARDQTHMLMDTSQILYC